MFDEARHPQSKTIRKAVVGPFLILCLFVLAGAIWLVVGGMVMRGAPGPGARINASL